MDIKRACLEILLRRVYFEWIDTGSSNGEDDYRGLKKERFLRLARASLQQATEDENEQMYEWLRERLREGNGIFDLIRETAGQFLLLDREDGICYDGSNSQFFHWKELVTGVGQEIFMMAFLAGETLHMDSQDLAKCICMPFPRLKVPELEPLLGKNEEGLAENHFHLKGSFPVFLLNWSCLMNHIGDRNDFFHQFQEYQEWELVAKDEDRQQKSIYLSVIHAAAYRLHLFECYSEIPRSQRLNLSGSEEFDESDLKRLQIQIDSYLGLMEALPGLSRSGGCRLHQEEDAHDRSSLAESGRADCPDYALYGIWEQCCHEDEMAVAGEKYFLYRCFRGIFRGDFGTRERNLFYRYLLIALRVRSELVQTNRKRGFANFLTYQNRKEDIIDHYKEEYEGYVMKLTACSLQRHQNLSGMELRISPKPGAVETLERIREYDEEIPAGDESGGENLRDRCFYVLHFPKRREQQMEELEPRDVQLRRDMDHHLYEQMELIRTEKYRLENEGKEPRVRGYDTCSGEIGCRPEVFAIFYRGIQQFAREQGIDWIHWTYHVGEDYLDITDGLRAIDEVLQFCELPEGSRLGHGMALGVDPEIYYQMRQHKVLLPAQDLLDNIAWTLGFCQEHGIVIPKELKSCLEGKFKDLWDSIYGREGKGQVRDKQDKEKRSEDGRTEDEPRKGGQEEDKWNDETAAEASGKGIIRIERRDGLSNPVLTEEQKELQREVQRETAAAMEMSLSDAYYGAWKLRGDRPQLYLEHPDGPEAVAGQERDLQENAEEIRKQRLCRELYLSYHYDTQARAQGRKTELFEVREGYAELIRRIQQELREILTKRKIGIECNPSSNYQIGPFERYENHPMLCMYGKNLNEVPAARMSVSINTDDMGIFQTSLEMEYLTMYMALCKCRTEDGRNRYSKEEILQWLRDVKRFGQEQAFGGGRVTVHGGQRAKSEKVVEKRF